MNVAVCAAHRFSDAAWVFLHERRRQGDSVAQIAKTLQCHRNSCYAWLSRDVPPSVWARQRQKVPPQVARRIVERRKRVRRLANTFFTKKGVPGPRGGTKSSIEIHRRQYPSLNALRLAFAAETGGANVVPSRATIRRDLLSLRYDSRRRPKTARLWAVDKEARVTFAKQYRGYDASRFVFSDETNAKIDDCGSCLTEWCLPGETPCPREVDQFPIRFHVWGAFGACGWRALRFLDESVTAVVYQRECLTPVLRRLRRRDTVYIHDGAKAHTASNAFLRERGIHVPAWPPHSPDLNPIENMWSIVARRVSQRGPVSLAEFKQCFREEFFAVDDAVIARLAQSFPTRLQQCVRKRGQTVRGPFH